MVGRANELIQQHLDDGVSRLVRPIEDGIGHRAIPGVGDCAELAGRKRCVLRLFKMFLISRLNEPYDFVRVINLPPNGGLFGIWVVNRKKNCGQASLVSQGYGVSNLGANLAQLFSLLDSSSDFLRFGGVAATFESCSAC